MKITHVETLLSYGPYSKSQEWKKTREFLHEAITRVDWPVGSGSFTIWNEHHGNGVVPIKKELMLELKKDQGWLLEQPLDKNHPALCGKVDATLTTAAGKLALEWETGNISSSHRALNKMFLGLLKGHLCGAILVVPSRAFYYFLTDRIGNEPELAPYYDLWKALPCKEGVAEIIVIEHDDLSSDQKFRIPKGTDGNAKKDEPTIQGQPVIGA